MIDSLRQAILIASLGLTAAVALPHAEEIGERTAENLPYVALAGACLYGSVKFTRSMLWYEQGGVDLSQAQSKQSLRVKTTAVTERANYQIGEIKGQRRVAEMEQSAQWMQRLAVYVDRHIEPALQPVVRREMGIRKLGDPSPAEWLAALPTAEAKPMLPQGVARPMLEFAEFEYVEREPEVAEAESALGIPVVDLGRDIAQSMLDTSSASSVLIACPRRTGKTSLLERIIESFHVLTQGQGEINIFNGKENRTSDGKLVDDFCGLANHPSRYLAVQSPDEAEQMFKRFEDLRELMIKPRDYYVLNVLDELNNMLLMANSYDSRVPVSSKIEKLIKGMVTHRATAGSSRKMCDVITSHSPYVKDIGINKAMQDNFCQVVLGRGQFVQAIEKALSGGSGSKPIVSDDKLCLELRTLFEQWNAEENDGSRVLALTNLDGWRLVYLPAKREAIRIKVSGPVRVAQPQSEVTPQPDPISYFQANASVSMSDDEIWAVWQQAGGNGNRSGQAIKQFRELLG